MPHPHPTKPRCSEPSAAKEKMLRKRKREMRPSTAVEASAHNAVSPIRPRPATASLATGSYGVEANVPEDMIEWRDPINGRRFYIDRRTGNSIAAGPASTRANGGDPTIANAVRPMRRVTLLNRSNLSNGLYPPLTKQTVASACSSSDEFDDPVLDAALASIPWPSAVTPIDASHHSRFFDSRRPDSQPTPRLLPMAFPPDTDHLVDRSSANGVELAVARSCLQQAAVLDQVDAKFIVCSISPSTSSNPILICIDQHAADERCRLERLLETFVADCIGGTAAHDLLCTLTLGITAHHFELIDKDEAVKDGLKRLGWRVVRVVMVHKALGHAQVDLSGVPYILREKALTSRGTVKDQDTLEFAFANCLEELAAPTYRHVSWATLAGELDWVTVSPTIPTSLMDVIKSTSCRSAIMFNDPLSKEASARLVNRLSECKFPFQCAHGRPSLVPLCEIKAQWRSEELDYR